MAPHEVAQYRLGTWCLLKSIEHLGGVTLLSNQYSRTSSDHGFKVTRSELWMVLSGDRMAAISDDLVRVMIRASQRLQEA